MKKRTTQPKNNKYYIRTVTGGLNGAVVGKPTIAGANVLCNCVGYANGRFNEICNDPNLTGTAIKFKYQLVCNAENFIESAKKQGLKINSTPIEGGIMVWQKGASLSGNDGAGHVAVVEEVYSDGSILTSESGWNAWAFKTVRRTNANGRWSQASGYKFRGCIINPTIKNPKVVPAPKLAVDGIGGTSTVRAMQKFFGTPEDGVISGQTKTLHAKYYPAFTAVEYGTKGSAVIKKLQKWVNVKQDGILGSATVKAWQKKIGATADGVFGANSMKKWQTYLNTHDKATYPTAETTLADKILDACKTQAAWMKNAKYGDYSPVTLDHSKTAGTCVTYEGCVLQRLGYLKSGQYVWHNGKGYGTGKVTGTNDKMTVTYMDNKTLKSLKSKLKAGDIVLLDDNKSGKKGSGGHVFFLTGEWTSAGNPYIWDFDPNRTCATKGKPRAYNGDRKVLAVVRLK